MVLAEPLLRAITARASRLLRSAGEKTFSVRLFIEEFSGLGHFDGGYDVSGSGASIKICRHLQLDDVLFLHYRLHYCEETPRDLKDELYAPGEVVAVRSPTDKLWYRARVIDHDSSSTEVSVFFLDTGDVERIQQMWVHPLLFIFLEGLPIQAFECTLHGVAMPEDGWTKEALKTVQMHTDGRPLHARVEGM